MNNVYKLIYTKNTLNPSISNMIVKNHYSKTARSLMPTHVFELLNIQTGEIVGTAVYGVPCGSNVKLKYGKKCVELRRLVIIERTVPHVTSWFLAATLRYLKNHTFVSGVITYADPNAGHTGTIYKACNFKYLGKELNPNPTLYKLGKKKIHKRQMYQKKNGKYDPSAKLYQKLLKIGKIKLIKQKHKERFFYNLNQ